MGHDLVGPYPPGRVTAEIVDAAEKMRVETRRSRHRPATRRPAHALRRNGKRRTAGRAIPLLPVFPLRRTAVPFHRIGRGAVPFSSTGSYSGSL